MKLYEYRKVNDFVEKSAGEGSRQGMWVDWEWLASEFSSLFFLTYLFLQETLRFSF